MEEAIFQAEMAAKSGEVPVGAVIVKNGRIIASAHNLVETVKNPLLHAEMVVINEASSILDSPRFTDCDLYVTLEPCAMCTQAISFARIRRLYFGAYDVKSGAIENGARIFSKQGCNHIPEIYGGINEIECSRLLKDFFANKR